MLASGRPVVATADPGTQLEAAVRGLGMVVPPGDTDAFAAAIAGLAVNRELRKAQGREARLYAETELDAPVILAAFERSLLELCGKRHAVEGEHVTESGDGEIASREARSNLAGVAGAGSDRKTFI
jgi:colanic acid biosynthesis glycosyl transferase WcaI